MHCGHLTSTILLLKMRFLSIAHMCTPYIHVTGWEPHVPCWWRPCRWSSVSERAGWYCDWLQRHRTNHQDNHTTKAPWTSELGQGDSSPHLLFHTGGQCKPGAWDTGLPETSSSFYSHTQITLFQVLMTAERKWVLSSTKFQTPSERNV